MIASWGEAGGKPWVISQQVNIFVEVVGEDNKALGQFLEGTIEGFGEGLTEFIHGSTDRSGETKVRGTLKRVNEPTAVGRVGEIEDSSYLAVDD